MCIDYTMEDLFPTYWTTQNMGGRKRKYEVRVSLNKSGDRWIVRIGFINKAVDIFARYSLCGPSDITGKCKNRIYFMPKKENNGERLYTISKQTNRDGKITNCEFKFTPTKEEEKMYRKYWAGKTYNLHYDEIMSLYYIEKQTQ